jgi:uncharacterized protein YneF (UPF0154 family)
MNKIQWIPLVVVLPTFAFIGYWIWRYGKSSDTGSLPRSTDEVRRVDPHFKDEFSAGVRKLRWFNLWLVLALIAGVMIASAVMKK